MSTKDPLIGKKIGRLTVIEFVGIKKTQHKDRLRNVYRYRCECECGNSSEISRSNLQNIRPTLSCGCLQKERSLIGHGKQRGKARPHVQKANGASTLHSIFLAYKNGAKKRNIAFELKEETFATLTSQNCNYCGTAPRELKAKKDSHSTRKMNGVDRIDSGAGYTLKNVVPCCKICNYMKQELSETMFYEHLKKILTHASK